jgi:membrane-bound inhibitor of C-type lysozyme
MQRREFTTILGAALIMICQFPAFAQTLRTYRCDDGSEFIAGVFEGDRRAHLQLDGKAVTLTRRISLSGSRYANGKITMSITSTGTIILKRGKRSTECSAE